MRFVSCSRSAMGILAMIALLHFEFVGSKQVSNIQGDNDDSENSKSRAIKRKEDFVEQNLMEKLFKNYNDNSRGIKNPNKPVLVNMQLLLLRVQDLLDINQVLTTSCLILTDWYDERLKWKPENHDNLTEIVVRPKQIWLPEISLLNGADEISPNFVDIRALVSHKGKINWEPGGIFRTTCDTDITYFPFDEQKCPIMIGSWAYHTLRMNYSTPSDTIILKDFKRNTAWKIVGTSAEWNSNILGPFEYSYIKFTISMQRRTMYYLLNIIAPCLILSVLVLLTFYLPPDSGEKISLGISVLLSFTVFLLMVAETIPKTSLHIPILVLYLTATLSLCTMSLIMTVSVINIHHTEKEHKMPKCCEIFFLHFVAKILRVELLSKKEKPEPDSMDCELFIDNLKKLKHKAYHFAPSDISDESSIEDNSNKWKDLAKVLDKLYFWIVFIAMFLSTTLIFTSFLY